MNAPSIHHYGDDENSSLSSSFAQAVRATMKHTYQTLGSTPHENIYFEEKSPPPRAVERWLQATLDCWDKHKKDSRLSMWFRQLFYNHKDPEFTALQLHVWALLLGLIMGVYTFVWKRIIEGGIELVWTTLPAYWHASSLCAHIPLYHYVWMVPTVFGGVLSYLFAVVPLPDQNEWITRVHSRGLPDYGGFWPLFVFSTLAMVSGLSLGPELPLVLTGSMSGAWLSKLCRQSILQTRVLTLTSASAAVGGFFGFPMAGAFFVLELPHRMGTEYFEAMGPAVFASIVAVLMNRWLGHEEALQGYFDYPPLTESLPSGVFTFALIIGLFGTLVGVAYAKSTKHIKTCVHDWFRFPMEYESFDAEKEVDDEERQLEDSLSTPMEKKNFLGKLPGIRHEGLRAAVAGTLAGFLVGACSIFLPHVMFWGEAQLQNLIDKGLYPLPVFGEVNEVTQTMTAHSFCMVDSDGDVGFGTGCAVAIAVVKTLAIGLSLGTGILGGHFWGPLYVGCASAHVYSDLVTMVADATGYGRLLAQFPAIIMLCFMGGAHVVTFRAHIAIILILTLTISSFGRSALVAKGDYAVVLPLLVVAVFVAGVLSRNLVFYKAQKVRGDLIAVPEVLCQPGQNGRPLMVMYDTSRLSMDQSTLPDSSDDTSSILESVRSGVSSRSRASLFPVPTHGEVTDHQPGLLEQSRMRSASSMSGSARSMGEADRPETNPPEVDLSTVDPVVAYSLATNGGFSFHC